MQEINKNKIEQKLICFTIHQNRINYTLANKQIVVRNYWITKPSMRIDGEAILKLGLDVFISLNKDNFVAGFHDAVYVAEYNGQGDSIDGKEIKITFYLNNYITPEFLKKQIIPDTVCDKCVHNYERKLTGTCDDKRYLKKKNNV